MLHLAIQIVLLAVLLWLLMRIARWPPHLKGNRPHLISNHHPISILHRISPPKPAKDIIRLIKTDLTIVLGENSLFIIVMNRNRRPNLVDSFEVLEDVCIMILFFKLYKQHVSI